MGKVTAYVRRLLLKEFKRNHTAIDAVRNICTFMGEKSLSYSTAKYWFKRFRQGVVSLKDRSRSGRPSKIDTQRLQTLIDVDPTQTTRNLAKKLNTSHSTIERYLREMGMKFSDSCWVYSKVTQKSSSQSLGLNRHAPNKQKSSSLESQSEPSSSLAVLKKTK